MLPERRQGADGWEPPLPLILAAWHTTPALPKMVRLAEHIEWAAKHNAITEISAYLRSLPEKEWFHLGE
jgi:hypothetical protein